jgi:hypothetical protein
MLIWAIKLITKQESPRIIHVQESEGSSTDERENSGSIPNRRRELGEYWPVRSSLPEIEEENRRIQKQG